MGDHQPTFRRVIPAALAAIVAGAALTACGPNYSAVTNRLRAENMAKDKEISTLQDQVATQDATIKSLQAVVAKESPPVQTLPPDRLAELYTVAKVEIMPATDSSDLLEGDNKLKGFRVYFRTLTQDRMIYPATGTLTIEAFELPPAPTPPVRLGTWTFSPEDMKKNWYEGLGLHHFAFNCPWSAPPAHSDVTFKVTFTDALTGITFEDHLDKKITLP
jgi:hypothetical protein